MQDFDFHTHSTFSDGENSPSEMIEAAIGRGLKKYGLSDHSYTSFDTEYCKSEGTVSEYIRAIGELKEKYKGKIEVLCGVEQDYFSDDTTDGFDYVIGSVHYVKAGDEYIAVDNITTDVFEVAKKYYGGDVMRYVEDYFELVSDVKRKTGADIIGHFDLVAKFNETRNYFDENDERYRTAWKRAADRLISEGAVFEINFGALNKGYRTVPYPSREIREYMKKKGARFVLSSDAHKCENIAKGFDYIIV